MAMNKNSKIFLGILILLILGFVVYKFNFTNSNTSTDPSNQLNDVTLNDTNSNTTISSVEVKEGSGATNGGVFVTLSNGNTLKIAQSKGPEDVSEIHYIISYRKAFISPDHRYVAVEATGFEEQFIDIYDVNTNILHKRTYGVVTQWTKDGLLEVRSCNLAGENCTDKISISNNKPWLFKQKYGVVVGNATLLNSVDFISNIKKSNDLSIFARILEAVGPEAIKGTGPFTIFVPNNEAFNALPAGTVDALFRPENKQKLIQLVRNHIMANEYNILDIENGMKINTIGNDTLLFTTNEWSYVRINGDSIITIPNIYSTNGVIQVITKVLVP